MRARTELALVAALGAALLAGCSAHGEPRPRETEAVRVERGAFRRVLPVSGRLVSTRAERLSVPVLSSWRSNIKWLIEEGSTVAAGDVVVRLDPAAQAADLLELENTLANKRQERAQRAADGERERLELQVALEEAALEAERARVEAAIPPDVNGERLHAEKDLAWSRAKSKLEQARLAVEAAGAKVRADLGRLDLELEDVAARFERESNESRALEVRAGRAGTVLFANHPWNDRKVRVGDSVQTSFPLAEISDNEDLAVEVTIPESEAALVRAGQAVSLVLDAFPSRRFKGTVKSVSLTAEQRKTWGRAYYFVAAVTVDGSDAGIMRPGMSVLCEITVQELPDVLLVPLGAARYDAGAFRVVPRGGRPLAIEPLGVDEFRIAVAPRADLAPGTPLEPAAGGGR